MNYKIEDLFEAYFNLMKLQKRQTDPALIQNLMSVFNSFTQTINPETQWSCGGCVARLKERVRYQLNQHGYLNKGEFIWTDIESDEYINRIKKLNKHDK